MLGVAVCSPQALWLREINSELSRVGRVARALCDLQWRGMVLLCTVWMLRESGQSPMLSAVEENGLAMHSPDA